MQVKKTKSPGLNTENEKNNKKPYVPSAAQNEIMAYYVGLLEDMRDQRQIRYAELDDLTYEEDYELNKRAANAYIPPKKNDDEVRIVTGTTEKKIEVVWNELISMNFQPEILAFDLNDTEIKGLGRDFEDIVMRTNEIERDDDFWRAFIRELLVQRAAFAIETDNYEVLQDRGITDLTKEGEIDVLKPKEIIYNRPKKKLLSGLQVYLGDMNIPPHLFQTQPYIALYFRKTYNEARKTYGGWKNWKFVKPGKPKNNNEPFYWRMNSLEKDEIEEIHIIDPWHDEYMIIINGVMMFDEPTACPYNITEDRKYNIVCVTLKEMGLDFALGKPLTASAKTLQGLNSEMVRLLIRKWRQILEPPVATTASKIYSKDIWTAGAVTYGLDAKEFQLLNPNQQSITQGEFNMYELIEKKTEEFIGAGNIAQGLSEKGGQTATEIINQQKRFIKQLGLAVLAVMKAKRDLTYQRIYNILENYTKPIGRKFDPLVGKVVDVYRHYTIMSGSFEDGQKGKKIIQFSDRGLEPEEKEQIFRFEQREERLGRPTRIRNLNVKLLNAIPILWHVEVNLREREGSALSRIMFSDQVRQAVGLSQISGRKLNGDKLIDEFEFIWKTKNWFQKGGEPVQQKGEVEAKGNELLAEINKLKQSKIGDQLLEGQIAGQTNAPSLNTLEGKIL